MLGQVRNLHWAIECAATGVFVASATALGPGRLLTTAHSVEDWATRPLRVRQGEATYPVRRVSLSAKEDIAILQVNDLIAAAPDRAARPPLRARLLVAGATPHGTFAGSGVVAVPPEGVANAGHYLTALLPALRGFSGAPVTDGNGQLVGIVRSAVVAQRADAHSLTHRDPAMAIDHRTILVIPNDVVDAVLRDERL